MSRAMDKNIKFMIIRCFIPLWGVIEALKGYNLLHLKKYDVEFYVIVIQIMYIILIVLFLPYLIIIMSIK